MDTNQIAAAVQAGEMGHIDLWENVRRFAYRQARRWCIALNGRGGVTTDDLMQCAYIAMVDTVSTWRSGAFLTWYGLKLKAAFTEACGLRTQRDRMEPLDSAISLDVPIGNDYDDRQGTLIDIIPDPTESIEDAFADQDFHSRKKAAIACALNSLQEEQRTVIFLRYFYGLSIDQAAEYIHATKQDVKRAEARAMRTLRNPIISRELRNYL